MYQYIEISFQIIITYMKIKYIIKRSRIIRKKKINIYQYFLNVKRFIQFESNYQYQMKDSIDLDQLILSLSFSRYSSIHLIPLPSFSCEWKAFQDTKYALCIMDHRRKKRTCMVLGFTVT